MLSVRDVIELGLLIVSVHIAVRFCLYMPSIYFYYCSDMDKTPDFEFMSVKLLRGGFVNSCNVCSNLWGVFMYLKTY